MAITSNILGSYQPLECKVCGKDLLAPNQKYNGIIVFEKDLKSDKSDNYVQCYAVCKGACDEKAKLGCISENNITAWVDVGDLQIPFLFLKEVFSIMNGIQDGSLVFEANSFDELKSILSRVSQLAFRDQSAEELARIKNLSEIPDWV